MFDHRVDLVHANDFAMASLGLVAARLAGAKIIVNRVDMGHPRPGFGRWHRKLEAFSARNADLVCANAEAVRGVCIDEEGCDPERVVVLRNGLELRTFDAEMARPGEPLPIEPGDLTIAMIGNLWPVKCHRVVVEAAALIRERLPRVKFLCAGEGVEKEPVRARIRELGLTSNVVLLGHRTDIPSILGRVQAFCLASSAEGLSNAVMEGMAARLPVVATRVGGNPELLASGRGILVPPKDPRALADAVIRVFEHPAESREMGKRARAFIEAELTLDRMQAAHEELYARALGLEPGMGANDARCEQAA
jgi:L-malate glycosyltransferase